MDELSAIKTSRLSLGGSRVMEDQKQIISEDQALRKILEGTASHTGKDFFRALVQNLAEALDTRGAWVTEILPGHKRAQTLAFWMQDGFMDDYEFEIKGTPCERVFSEKRLYHIPDNILDVYPEEQEIDDQHPVSYLGAPLLDLDGTILGNVAVLDTRPMPEEARNITLFKIFADRAASELRRLNAERQLHNRTEELKKEYRRKTRELESARTIQLNMLPQAIPSDPDYRFSFSMKTASEVGGDYYDYQVAGDRSLTFGIGDATGHGLQASVMVTAIKLLFAEHASTADITDFLTRASRSISLMGFHRLYMAFGIGRLANHTLELAGAGMPPALVYRTESKALEPLDLKGLPLGSRVEFPYSKITTVIRPGDVVVLMTDGLAESFNADGEMLGYERVSQLILEVVHKSPEEIIHHLNQASAQWLNGSPQDDDMTFFVFKREPG